MPVGKKLVLAVSLLASGAGTAFFFRKDASQRQEAFDDFPQDQRVDRRVTGHFGSALASGHAARQTARPTQALRVPSSATASIAEPKSAGDGAPTFQKSFNPVGALLAPIDASPHDVADEAALTETDDAVPNDGPGTFTTHKIVDGDTLSSLAIRYLGRAERYREIFDLNRDVLVSPDLLPIGVMLKIPPRDGDRTPSSMPGSSGGPAKDSAAALEIVPARPR